MSRVLGILAAAVALAAPRTAPAVIIMGDEGRNLTPAPFGLDRYTGTFFEFLGVPITPRHFVTATHLNLGSGPFSYNNGTTTTTVYNATRVAVDGDLAVYRIADVDPNFTLFAPIYALGDEVSRDLVTIGRGTARGAEVRLPDNPNGSLRGWAWGTDDLRQSWGTNTVAAIATADAFGDLLYFTFDRLVDEQGRLLNPNEGTYSARDSGGPVFLQDPYDGAWKLAGINTTVDGPFSHQPQGPYRSLSLFDARGFYVGTPNDHVYLDPNAFPNPLPTGSYATRISSRLAFLQQATNFGVVPEPAAVALLLLGCGGCLLTGRLWQGAARRRLGTQPGIPANVGAGLGPADLLHRTRVR